MEAFRIHTLLFEGRDDPVALGARGKEADVAGVGFCESDTDALEVQSRASRHHDDEVLWRRGEVHHPEREALVDHDMVRFDQLRLVLTVFDGDDEEPGLLRDAGGGGGDGPADVARADQDAAWARERLFEAHTVVGHFTPDDIVRAVDCMLDRVRYIRDQALRRTEATALQDVDRFRRPTCGRPRRVRPAL